MKLPRLLLIFGALALLASCESGPARVLPPVIDADAAAAAAMTQYDANGDGVLSGAELDKVPGIKGALAFYDSDNDGKVTAPEIAARIKSWAASKIGLMAFSCKVTLDTKPLKGATVSLVPEAFLGDALESAEGITDVDGVALPALKKGEQTTYGVRPGLYRISITHPTAKIPARYNRQTTLGLDIANDSLGGRTVTFELRSN